MSSIDIVKQIVVIFDKIDKIILLFGFILIIIGADFKVDFRGFVVNFDRKQILYFRSIGLLLMILSFLPIILSYYFRPVLLKDLVDLKNIIDGTQISINNGTPTVHRSQGDNQYHAMKEMPFASNSNTRAQVKIDDMINSLRSFEQSQSK